MPLEFPVARVSRKTEDYSLRCCETVTARANFMIEGAKGSNRVRLRNERGIT
jgi:hypothetical protein